MYVCMYVRKQARVYPSPLSPTYRSQICLGAQVQKGVLIGLCAMHRWDEDEFLALHSPLALLAYLKIQF